jgi:hypothetical protein
MSIKHSDLKIESGNPFANCQLEREKYAKVLLDLVNAYADGFVLAINNKWGTGKTTFIKMWEQDLIDKSYKTVYFNAWENDFENNALTALMGELKNLTKEATEPKFKKVLKNAALLSKSIAPILIQSILDKYISTKEITDAIVGITNGINDVFENEVNDYANKKKGINEFRKSLAEFITDTNEGRPLIFIIDELDRCRPDYAVSILEQIKHFFSVPNIVFVLSIDKVQLGNSVKGVYGNDNIDADEYLRRFIDIEYSIPDPDPELYYKYLYNYFEFDQFFTSDNRIKNNKFDSDKSNFLGLCAILFSKGEIALRQQEKIFVQSKLALRSFKDDSYIIPQLFIFLVYLKIIHEDLYIKVNRKSLSIEEMQSEFFKIIGNKINNLTEKKIIRLEVYLVNAYSNFKFGTYPKDHLLKINDDNSKYKLVIKSVSDKSDDAEFFLKDLENMVHSDVRDISMEQLLKKINLTEVFN